MLKPLLAARYSFLTLYVKKYDHSNGTPRCVRADGSAYHATRREQQRDILMNMMKIHDTRNLHSRSASGKASEAGPSALIRLRVADLLAGTRQAILEHNGEDYRLRITSSGKLILTK